MEDNVCPMVKIVLLGGSGTGKTSLLSHYCDKTFKYSVLSTIGADMKYKTITIGDKKVKLQIWDTPGHERFISSTLPCCSRADGIIFVYDVTSETLFELKKWMQAVESCTVGVEKLLVGNKCDSVEQRVITEDMGKELARDHSIPFIEASAMTGLNVNEAFEMLATAILKKGCAGQKKKGDVEFQKPRENRRPGK